LSEYLNTSKRNKKKLPHKLYDNAKIEPELRENENTSINEKFFSTKMIPINYYTLVENKYKCLCEMHIEAIQTLQSILILIYCC